MSFAHAVGNELEKRTCAQGFRRVKGVVRKALNADASVGVGYLTKTVPSGSVTVFVVVSVRFESIYKLGLELGAYPASDGHATLYVGLNYLVPPDVSCDYEFLPDANNEPLFDRIIHDVMLYGVPIFADLSTVEGALQTVQRGGIEKVSGREEFIPLALARNGKLAEARLVSEEFKASMDTSRGTGKRYAAFVQALGAMA